jgi:hypothetical protein
MIFGCFMPHTVALVRGEVHDFSSQKRSAPPVRILDLHLSRTRAMDVIGGAASDAAPETSKSKCDLK